MISLVVNRAGSVPVVDMSYHTPTVYIFSILEVNIAILCASIPIFWPMIASFTSNKILVVNEISVLVEEYPKSSLDGEPGIGLAEQGAWRYDDGKDSPPLSPRAQAQPAIQAVQATRARADVEPPRQSQRGELRPGRGPAAREPGVAEPAVPHGERRQRQLDGQQQQQRAQGRLRVARRARQQQRVQDDDQGGARAVRPPQDAVVGRQ
jgi:hypothetical protein